MERQFSLTVEENLIFAFVTIIRSLSDVDLGFYGFSMNQVAVTGRQDLSIRTEKFALRVRKWIRCFPKNMQYSDDAKQLIRSSGSVGANYIEANESLGRQDCAMHLKICRKEARESAFWLRLLSEVVPEALEQERTALHQESEELLRIFQTIIHTYYT